MMKLGFGGFLRKSVLGEGRNFLHFLAGKGRMSFLGRARQL